MVSTPRQLSRLETPRSFPDTQSTVSPNARSSLRFGAEAMMYAGPSDATARHWQKRRSTSARPPPHPGPEHLLPAGRSTGIHAPRGLESTIVTPTAMHGEGQKGAAEHLCEGSIYGGRPRSRDEDRETQRQPWFRKKAEVGKQDDEEALPDGWEKLYSSEFREYFYAHTASRESSWLRPQPGSAAPRANETARYLTNFLARARQHGAHGIPDLGKLFQVEAGADGTLNENGFAKVAMAEGLCRCFHESKSVFGHFLGVTGGTVKVWDLLAAFRGDLPPHRAAVIEEVWAALDYEGQGSIQATELLHCFDPRHLPAVRFGGVHAEEARRQFMRGLGLVVPHGSVWLDFALEETHSKRRSRPIGVMGAPMAAPAGRPTLQGGVVPREHGDYKVVPPSAMELENVFITAFDFEEYYTAVSSTIHDDELFKQTVRAPWTSKLVYDEGQANRMNFGTPNATKKSSDHRVFVTFDDGSQKIVVLRDDHGLEKISKCAGSSTSQLWSWGPDVYKEVARRLEVQENRRIRKIRPQF